MNNCENCHWWFKQTEQKDDMFRICVWHVGSRRTPVQKIDVGSKLILTRADFGCVDFEPRKEEVK